MLAQESHWTVLTEVARQLPAFVMALVALLTILGQMHGLRKLIARRLDELGKRHHHPDQVGAHDPAILEKAAEALLEMARAVAATRSAPEVPPVPPAPVPDVVVPTIDDPAPVVPDVVVPDVPPVPDPENRP